MRENRKHSSLRSENPDTDLSGAGIAAALAGKEDYLEKAFKLMRVRVADKLIDTVEVIDDDSHVAGESIRVVPDSSGSLVANGIAFFI